MLSSQTLVVLIYTLYVGDIEGWDFLTVAQNNLLSLTWNGQFSLDFSCYLVLSGLWLMWRNQYNASGVLLGLVAMILGIVVFAPYLLHLLWQEKGDIKKVLLGRQF
ncbi:MAG: hypothetical protein MUE85_19880 [Microscillaceae bacterium]|nr:hypothetical protein [Microscillaceae bacterium]